MTDSDWPLLVAIGAALTALAAVLLAYTLRARRRVLEVSQPFPAQWRSLLAQRVALYGRMPADLRLRLEPLVRGFLADVEFIGCQGLEITAEMRLIISIQACLLVADLGPRAYDSLRSVLVYPDEFVVEEADEDEAGVVTEGARALSGQAFEASRIVLSWRDVLESGSTEEPYNVVLHEFAHYLDHSVGGALTAPAAKHPTPGSWHAVLEREYAALCAAVDRGEATLIDPYAAERPEEFFAVATETFFEAPRQILERHPHLYRKLQGLYGLDPAAWT